MAFKEDLLQRQELEWQRRNPPAKCKDSAPYMVWSFYWRPDNQGNGRLFRMIDVATSIEQARAFFRGRTRPGNKHLYVVLIRRRDYEALAEYGDPRWEEAWLDMPTSPEMPHVG